MKKRLLSLLVFSIFAGVLLAIFSQDTKGVGNSLPEDLLLTGFRVVSGGIRTRAGRGELAVRYAGFASLQNTRLQKRENATYRTDNGIPLAAGTEIEYRYRGETQARFTADVVLTSPASRVKIATHVHGRKTVFKALSSGMGFPVRPGERLRIRSDGGDAWLYNPSLQPATVLTPSSPSIILHVVIDAMRQDALVAFGGDRRVAPHLNRLAREASQFAAAYTAANWTRPSTTAFFTGLFPSQSRIPTTVFALSRADREAYSKVNPLTLPLALRRRGWLTLAVVNNIFMVGTTPLGLDCGFNTVLDIRKDGPDTRWITERALRLIPRGRRRKLYLFLNYNAPHGPYTPPVAYTKQLPASWPDHYRRYMGEVALSDAALGRVLSRLKAEGLYEEALIIVHSDHGEILHKRHSRAAYFPYFLRYTHGETAYREEISVPLLVKYPKSDPRYGKRRERAPFSLAALPDLVYRGAVRDTPSPFPGNTVFADTNGFLFFEGRCLHAVTDGSTAYSRRLPGYDRVQYRLGGGRTLVPEELYDLTKDPGERTNLIRKRPLLATRMRRVYEGHPLRPRPARLSLYFPLAGEYRVGIRMDNGAFYRVPESAIQRHTVQSNRFTATLHPDAGGVFELEILPPRFSGSVVIIKNGKKIQPLTGAFGIPLLDHTGRVKNNMDLRMQGPLVYTPDRRVSLWFEGLDSGSRIGSRTSVTGEMRDMLKSWGYIQ